jgi:hypothetical protein
MLPRHSRRNALTFFALVALFAAAMFASKKPPLHPINLNSDEITKDHRT